MPTSRRFRERDEMSGKTLRWVIGGTIVLVLLILAWAFVPTGPSAPPPPEPLPRSVLERAAPATPVVEAHPSTEVPADMKERRDFRESAPHVAERKPPTLRFNDPGIAPWQLVT